MERKKIDTIRSVFQQFPEIQAVYLFGSSVSGKKHSESDIDLALVPGNHRAREKKMSLLAELARSGFDSVDIVFLDTDDIVLRYEAVRQNNLVYSTQDFDRGAMYSKVVRQYLDFEPCLAVQRRAMKRRMLDGQA